jgi:hypothetical protein
MRISKGHALMAIVAASLAGAHGVPERAEAQIYLCIQEDGTRHYSDERCGPDAKVVPGITSKKRPATNASGASRPARVQRTPAELEDLLAKCNDGDARACSEWTHGGGPNQLREQEQKAAAACDAGSLPDCEQRYCLDGITEECRARVVGAAKLAGETWYLRQQTPKQLGVIEYEVRCSTPGVRAIRDFVVTCSAQSGPRRCALASGEAFARLDQAAATYCAK